MSGSRVLVKILKQVGRAHARSVREQAHRDRALERHALLHEKAKEADRKKLRRELEVAQNEIAAKRKAAEVERLAFRKSAEKASIKQEKMLQRKKSQHEKNIKSRRKLELAKQKKAIKEENSLAKAAFERRCENRTAICQKYIDAVLGE